MIWCHNRGKYQFSATIGFSLMFSSVPSVSGRMIYRGKCFFPSVFRYSTYYFWSIQFNPPTILFCEKSMYETTERNGRLEKITNIIYPAYNCSGKLKIEQATSNSQAPVWLAMPAHHGLIRFPFWEHAVRCHSPQPLFIPATCWAKKKKT